MALIQTVTAILGIQLYLFSFVKCSVSIKDKDVHHYSQAICTKFPFWSYHTVRQNWEIN